MDQADYEVQAKTGECPVCASMQKPTQEMCPRPLEPELEEIAQGIARRLATGYRFFGSDKGKIL